MTNPGHIISETVWILDIGVKSRVLSPLDHVYQMALRWLLLGSQLTAYKGHYPSRDRVIREARFCPEACLMGTENWLLKLAFLGTSCQYLSIPSPLFFLTVSSQHPHISHTRYSRRQSESEGNIEIARVHSLIQ